MSGTRYEVCGMRFIAVGFSQRFKKASTTPQPPPAGETCANLPRWRGIKGVENPASGGLRGWKKVRGVL